MNIVLHNTKGDEYYIVSLKVGQNAGGYLAIGKRVSNDGRLISIGQTSRFQDRKLAERRVRDQIKIKIKRRGWQRVNLESLPVKVVKYLEVPPEMQVTPEELVMVLRKAQAERYVIFKDVAGLEEYFDAGVEYLGYVTDDEHTIKVFDRFGALRDCFINRLLSVDLTERAIESKTSKIRTLSAAIVEDLGGKA